MPVASTTASAARTLPSAKLTRSAAKACTAAPRRSSTPAAASAASISGRGPGPSSGPTVSARSIRTMRSRSAAPSATVHQQPVAQLERQLDAGEASADDGDGRLRDVTDDLAEAPVEGDRLRLGVNRKCRLGAWHRRPAHAAAGRDDQAVIGEAVASGERHGFGGGVEPDRLAAHEADVDLAQERQQSDSERLRPRLVEPWPDFEHRLRRHQGHSGPGNRQLAGPRAPPRSRQSRRR